MKKQEVKNREMKKDKKNHLNLSAYLKRYRLTMGEYRLIKKILGRAPKALEWPLFSALWSEHCSYKSSAVHLKKLFFKSPKVVSAFGENAGVVDLGQGEKVAFKVESHNHPSFIAPYHGAATGVGGILRDVFVMNARPILLADYLCFGVSPKTTKLIDGVVRGIGGYGNSIGIPVVTGRTEFHSSYNKNVVVNALALGYFGPKDKVMVSKAKGPGNLLVYAGARTGRDGIHGASMASESFKKSNTVESNKASVQIGDPFYGKLLMEACLEVIRKNLVVSAQDMGAAGLISSSFEMVTKGNLGFRLYLDKVPLRADNMTPEEILLSESQERVLLVVKPDRYKSLEKVFVKWGLPVCVVGELTKKKTAELFWKKKLLTSVRPSDLTEKAPRYHRPYYKQQGKKHSSAGDAVPSSARDAVSSSAGDAVPSSAKELAPLSLLKGVNGRGRKSIYRQYDQRVGGSTVKDCSFPFGVVRLPSSGRALGICMGGRPHIMRMDSLEGGKDSVLEPALQLSLRGFEPLALTDGLNFGSPENKKVMSSFVHCIEGMAQSARVLKTPVVSGNVSFYNETQGKGISPAPVTGMIGIKNKLRMPSAVLPNISRAGFKKNSLGVYLLSAHQVFCRGLAGETQGQVPIFYGSLQSKVCQEFMNKIRKRILLSAPSSAGDAVPFSAGDAVPFSAGDAVPSSARDAVPSSVRDAVSSAFCSTNGVIPVRDAVPSSAVLCARLVEKFGLAYTLSCMLKESALGMKVETDYDPFEERLYEVVLILNDKAFTLWNKVFSSDESTTRSGVKKTGRKKTTRNKNPSLFKLEKIGEIIEQPMFYFNKDITLSVKEIAKAYDTGFFS